MLDKLVEVERRFEDLEAKLSDPGIFSRGDEYRKTTKERADLEPIIEAYRELKRLEADIAGNAQLLTDADAEMREMAEAELGPLRARGAHLRGRRRCRGR